MLFIWAALVFVQVTKRRRNFTSNWGFLRQKDYDTKITIKVPPISVIWAVLAFLQKQIAVAFVCFCPERNPPFYYLLLLHNLLRLWRDRLSQSEGIKGRNCLILSTAWLVYSGHDYSWLFLYRFGRCIDRALFPQTAFSFSVNGLALVVRLTRQKNKSDSALVHTFSRSQSGLHDTFARAEGSGGMGCLSQTWLIPLDHLTVT